MMPKGFIYLSFFLQTDFFLYFNTKQNETSMFDENFIYYNFFIRYKLFYWLKRGKNSRYTQKQKIVK